jgi:hypothetical protein
MRPPSSRLVLSLILSLSSLGVIALPAQAPALGGTCGSAIPCECGDEFFGSRTLVFGVDPITVTPCAGEGLIFNEGSHRSLNLGGNTIRAAAGNVGTDGIRLNDTTHNTVTGGAIVGFGTGIGGRIASLNLFSDLQIVEGSVGIRILGGGNTIQRSVFRRLSAGAITISDGAGTQILGNRIEDSGVGVTISTSPFFDIAGETVIARNLVLRSSGNGLTVHSSRFALGAIIDRNQVKRSGGDGVVLSGTNVRVTSNVASDNAGNGFDSRGLTDSTFHGNRAQANDLFGMVDDSAGDGTAGTANTYTRNNRCSLNGLGDSEPPGLCF